MAVKSRKSRNTPWIRYATGNWWELIPGEDHDQGVRAAVEAARCWAKRNQYRVDVKLPPPRDGEKAPWKIRFRKIGEQIGGP